MGPLACNLLRDNYGAHMKERRVGRGIGSKRGRKSGRGQKGQKARAGNHGIARGTRDGQTMIEDQVPKSRIIQGPHNQRKVLYKEVSLADLQAWVSSGRVKVPEDRPLGVKDLFDARLVTLRQKYAGIKLRSRGKTNFKTPLKLEVQDADPAAIKAVEAAGGSLETVYYTRLTLRGLLKPEKFVKKGRLNPRPALPPPKLMRDIYANEAKRGYLRNLKPGDVVRPQEHPAHVDLSLKVPQPKYPRWQNAKWQYEKQLADEAKAKGGD